MEVNRIYPKKASEPNESASKAAETAVEQDDSINDHSHIAVSGCSQSSHRATETAVEQDDSINNHSHIAVSGCSQSFHGAISENTPNTASPTDNRATFREIKTRKTVYTRDMDLRYSPPPAREWSKRASYFRRMPTPTSEEEGLLAHGILEQVAELRERNRLLYLEQNIEEGYPQDELFSGDILLHPLTGLPVLDGFNLPNSPDFPGRDYNSVATMETGVERPQVMHEIPFRQHEPSAETVDISPPVSSPVCVDDNLENSQKLLTDSSEPLLESSSRISENREENNVAPSSGQIQTSAPECPMNNAMKQSGENTEGHSPEFPRTTGKEKGCQGVFLPSAHSSQICGFQNTPDGTFHRESSPSTPTGILLPPRTRMQLPVSESPKQGTNAIAASAPGRRDFSEEDITTRSEDPNLPLDDEPLEVFSMQQLGNSPTSSQDECTALVRSWILRGKYTPSDDNVFAEPKASTRASSAVEGDSRVLITDESSSDGESRKAETEKDNGDLISLIGSPSPSSRLEMPWTSVSHIQNSKDVVSSELKVMPYTETIDGASTIVFPGNVIQEPFTIHIFAKSDFDHVDNKGWREFMFPGFDTLAGRQKGTFLFKFAEDRKPFQFNTNALPWASIDTRSLLAEFDLSQGITLPVHMLNSQTHTLLDGFTIDSTIKSTYRLSHSSKNCFTIEYTATCTFTVTRQDFWAERCCFYILLEGGPWGRFDYSLDEHDWHVRLDSEQRVGIWDTEIKVSCPFEDIGKPFDISWVVDLEGFPAKSWVPRIRPISPEEHSPRPAWCRNLGRRYEAAVSNAVMDNDADNEFDVEEIPDNQNETADGDSKNEMENQDASEDEVYDNRDSSAVKCGHTLAGEGRFGRRVQLVQPESDTSSEFIDHPGSPWFEPDFGMISFFIPLLFIIGGLLRKIIGHKIRQICRLLKNSVRSITFRTWMKIGSLVYLGSLCMGANPIQRLDEIVHTLATVERRATAGFSPLEAGREDTVVTERPGLLIVQSSLENFCDALSGAEPGVVLDEGRDIFSFPVPADEFWQKFQVNANKNPDKLAKEREPEWEQKGKLGDGSESAKITSGQPDTMSTALSKTVYFQPTRTPQTKVLSMRDRVDRILGWRDPEEF